MNLTAICHGGYIGGPAYHPGDHLNLPEKKARANLDVFAFVRGHHDLTPAAAQRVRDHYHETGERLDVAEIDGTGADGRILVEDVERAAGVAEAVEPQEPEADEPDDAADDEPATFSEEE